MDFFGPGIAKRQRGKVRGVVFVEIEKQFKMAREGVGFLGAGAGNGATAIGAIPPVLGIFCAPARPRGSTRTTGAPISAPERLKTAILVHIVRNLRNTDPQLHQATKAPTDTHRFAPTALASDTRSFKAAAAPKKPAPGASRDMKCQKHRKQRGVRARYWIGRMRSSIPPPTDICPVCAASLGSF
jgi:hypothetical protein